MKIRRYFSDKNMAPYDGLAFRRLAVATAGGLARHISVPATWPVSVAQAFSNHALLKVPLPGGRRQLHEAGIPHELRRHEILPGTSVSHRDQNLMETDIRSAIDRVTGSLARSGLDVGYFDTASDAVSFRDELRAMLSARQVTLSAQTWQILGGRWAYGIDNAAEADLPGEPDPATLSSPDFLYRVTADARRNHDAAALAMGRSSLADVTKAIKSAIADGGADPSNNADLRTALANAQTRGLPASAARQLIDAFLAGDKSWPDADTHLDSDSDIWELLGHPTAYTVCKTPTCGDDGLEELSLASFRGEAPRVVFGAHGGRTLLTAGNPSHPEDRSQATPEGFIPTGAINLLSFALNHSGNAKSAHLDIDGLVHAVRLLTIALDIAHAECESGSEARSVAVCPADMAALLMSFGVAYSSEQGRALAATISALVSASALAASAQMARKLGSCVAFDSNRKSACGFVEYAQNLLLGQPTADQNHEVSPELLYPHSAEHARVLDAARDVLDRAANDMSDAGLRNLSLTRICDDADMTDMLAAESRGLAPVHTLVKYRHLTPELDPAAIYKVVSPAVPAGLRALFHDDASIDRILDHVVGTGSLDGAPGVNHSLLRERGFSDEDIEVTETALATAGNIGTVFTPYVLGWDDALDDGADLLLRMGFSDWDVEHANYFCCGALTLEGSRDLPHEHLPVFDCDEPLGEIGTRHVSVTDRMLMAQAVQPFVTDGLDLDLKLPADSTIENIVALYRRAETMGLASIRLNRAGTALSEPMDYDDLFESVATGPSHEPADDIEANIYVRSMEAEEPPLTGDDADALTLAISVGLKNGIPVEAFQEAFSSFASKDSNDALARSLTSMARSYLVPTTSEKSEMHQMRTAEPDAATGPLHDRKVSQSASPSDVQHPSDEIGGRRSISASAASRAFGDPALSPPSVSGRSREE